MKKHLLLISIFILFSNCQEQNEKYLLLEKYVHSNFDANIKDGNYVVVPLNVCHTCVEKMILKLQNPKINKNTVVIIVDYSKINFQKIKSALPNTTLLFDNKMSIVKSGIISGNYIEVFVIKNQKIDKIEYHPNVNDNEIERVLYY